MYMVNQLKKLLKTARQTNTAQGRVSNEQQAVINSILMGITSTPAGTEAEEEQLTRVPSKRRGLQFLDFCVPSGIRKMKVMEQKRKTIRRGQPTKKEWAIITSRAGKYKNVKEEDSLKIIDWV